MTRKAWSIALLFSVLLWACSGSEAPFDSGEPDATTLQDSGSETDTALSDLQEQVDVTSPPPVLYEAPDAKLRASVSWGSMGVPIGASTSGYGQTPPEGSPVSPFAHVFQATDTIVQEPGVRVLHLLKGDARVIMVVTDIVGIYYTHFEQLVDLVEERIGLDISENLIFMANHSHAGPAGVVNIDLAAFVMDTYDSAYTYKIMNRIADSIVSALTMEAEPISFGYAVAQNSEMHEDRRCENPEYQNDRMGILRFDKADGSGPLAVIINYAMHGTVLNPENACLSGDAPRTVEQKVRESIDGGPMVMFLQSWAGDMSPGSISIPDTEEIPAVEEYRRFDKMEALGLSAANTVNESWDSIEMAEDVELGISTKQVPFGLDEIGYEPEDFDLEFGGFMCGGTQEYCPGEGKVANMKNCLPVPEDYAIPQARISAVKIGPVALVTLPGEPVTTLGEYVVDGARVATGAEEAFLLGYAQDYTGYLLLEDDWGFGGYEAASNFWGPRQGVYLADSVISVAAKLFDEGKELSFAPAEPLEFTFDMSAAYEPSPSIDAGLVEEDVPVEVQPNDVVRFGFLGGDPWLGTPTIQVHVQDESAEAFAPLISGGRVMDVESYRVHVKMTPQPSWEETMEHPESGRRFIWWAELRTAVPISGADQVLAGVYRFHVKGKALDEEGNVSSYTLDSAPFKVFGGASQ